MLLLVRWHLLFLSHFDPRIVWVRSGFSVLGDMSFFPKSAPQRCLNNLVTPSRSASFVVACWSTSITPQGVSKWTFQNRLLVPIPFTKMLNRIDWWLKRHNWQGNAGKLTKTAYAFANMTEHCLHFLSIAGCKSPFSNPSGWTHIASVPFRTATMARANQAQKSIGDTIDLARGVGPLHCACTILQIYRHWRGARSTQPKQRLTTGTDHSHSAAAWTHRRGGSIAKRSRWRDMISIRFGTTQPLTVWVMGSGNVNTNHIVAARHRPPHLRPVMTLP